MWRRAKKYGYLFLLICINQNSFAQKKQILLSWQWPAKIGITATENVAYPRAILDHTHRIQIVYESPKGILGNSSEINGKLWLEEKLLQANTSTHRMSNPEIFQTRNKTLILAVNLRPRKQNQGQLFGIAIKRKEKNKDWSELNVVFEAGDHFGNGCYEPVIRQLPNSQLMLQLSSETEQDKYPGQHIRYLLSKDDGKTWNDRGVFSYRNDTRQGMSVPAISAKKKEVLTIVEDPSQLGESIMSIVRADAKGNAATIKEDILPDSLTGGAGYLIRLKDGTCLATVQSPYGQKQKDSEPNFGWCALLASDQNGRNFKVIDENVFETAEGKRSSWNSILLIGDNTFMVFGSQDHTIVARKGMILVP